MKETRDILVLFEALNNHEIFTPPKLTKEMLDLLPKEVWTNPSLRFLDPCTKSGVFLREIFYKLYEGLKNKGIHGAHDGLEYNLTNDQERINHILKNMIYGIATSELTGYVARRTLYGVMEANTDKQIAAIDSFTKSENYNQWSEEEQLKFVDRNKFNEYYNYKMFDTDDYKGFEEEGNIFYPADEVAKKVLEDGNYEIEDTYYPFINEETKHQKILDIKEGKMKFDVIIGNPPYQISDNAFGAGASPIYNKFISSSIKLNPKYLSMIVPSRWLTNGKGLDSFRKEMFANNQISKMFDCLDSGYFFPSVDVKGGINYFLWENNYKSKTLEYNLIDSENSSISTKMRVLNEHSVFIRNNVAAAIIKKVLSKSANSIESLASGTLPFGIPSNFTEYKSSESTQNPIKLYGNKSNMKSTNGIGYINKMHIKKHPEWLDKHKVLVPKATGNGHDSKVLATPIYSQPNSVCSHTYIVVNNFESKEEALNFISYIKTKFFRYLVSVVKNTQDATRGVYKFVPNLSMCQVWDDKKLYNEFKLTAAEVKHIEDSISVME